jgi:predicted GIY-YIG superfamily endonuclease
MDKKGVIYKATNTINGKVYIGLTTLSMPKRKASHKSGLKGRRKTHKGFTFTFTNRESKKI